MSIVGDDCNTKFCVFVTIDPLMFQYYNLALVQATFIVLQLDRRVGSFVTVALLHKLSNSKCTLDVMCIYFTIVTIAPSPTSIICSEQQCPSHLLYLLLRRTLHVLVNHLVQFSEQ